MGRIDAALRERGLQTRMLLQVHDELLFEAPPEEIAGLEPLVREITESAMPLTVPARVDIKIGDDWSQVWARVSRASRSPFRLR
jgi:DNA polymerase-1